MQVPKQTIRTMMPSVDKSSHSKEIHSSQQDWVPAGRLANPLGDVMQSPFSTESSTQEHKEKPMVTTQPSTSSWKSQGIPIIGPRMKRTPSEVKLHQEEEIADYRDYAMFRRIVDGISKQEIRDGRLRKQNELCLAHLIEIRNGSHYGSPQHSNQRYMLSDFGTQTRNSRDRWTLAMEQEEEDDEDIFLLEL
jgi:hypothetical protein